ncbi:hypothetical protein FFB58_20240 [Enterobacter sp. MF024]|nr:hypothetical protein FFB58_20240 [Enterobacter sp. MF024]
MCDLSHVNVGGVVRNEVINITKMTCKKNTMNAKAAVKAIKCETNHISSSRICFRSVIKSTKNFYADFSGCDRWQHLLLQSTPGCNSATLIAKKA